MKGRQLCCELSVANTPATGGVNAGAGCWWFPQYPPLACLHVLFHFSALIVKCLSKIANMLNVLSLYLLNPFQSDLDPHQSEIALVQVDADPHLQEKQLTHCSIVESTSQAFHHNTFPNSSLTLFLRFFLLVSFHFSNFFENCSAPCVCPQTSLSTDSTSTCSHPASWY